MKYSHFLFLLPFTFHLGLEISPAFSQSDRKEKTTQKQEKSKKKKEYIDKIVVTARLRKESLQDVPISETAFSAQQIEEAGINQVDDFINLTPNITIAQAQSSGISFITLRGISQVRNGEPPVAVVVDDVLQINSRQFTQELFDLERIEVLRGPQGALYGRNATGGAILITTKQPTDKTTATARVSYAGGDEISLLGGISGALLPKKLFYRISGKYLDRKGYFENVTLGKKADPYKDLTLRGLLKWQPHDRLEIDLRGAIVRTRAAALNHHFQLVTLDADHKTNGFTTSGTGADSVGRIFYANNPGYNLRRIDEASLKIVSDLTEGIKLTSVTSWSHVQEDSSGDQFPYTAATTIRPGTPAFFDGTQTQYADIKAFSQEVRIASKSNQKLRWMFGGYYLATDRFISTTSGEDNGFGIFRVRGNPVTDPKNPTTSFFADKNRNKAWALFGNLSYDITPQIEVSGALRYDVDQRAQYVSPQQTTGKPGAINKKTYQKLQPKLSLKYKPVSDWNLYASWGQGFRSGQFNQNGVGVIAKAAGIAGVTDAVDAETTETTELGFKSLLFNRHLRVNGALYQTEVTGQHYFVFIGAVSAQVLVNIGKVELLGGELEALYTLSDHFDIFSSFGYTKSKITDYSLDSSVVGNKAPYVPDSTFNFGAQYRVQITPHLKLFLRGDYERRGAQYWDPENTTQRSALNLINARIGLEGVEKDWSLILSASNITDKRYNAEWVFPGFAALAAPRVLRAEFQYRF